MQGLDMSKAYDVGRQAARSKVGIDNNPYPLDRKAEAHEWLDGYMEEANKMRIEELRRGITRHNPSRKR